MKNSSYARSNQTLAQAPFGAKAKKLLMGLANLSDDSTSGRRYIQNNFPYVLEDLPSRPVLREAQFADGQSYPYIGGAGDEESKYRCLVLPLRNRLRALWLAPGLHAKRWGMFRVSQDFFLQGDATNLHSPLDNDWDFLLTGMRPRSRTERLLMEFIDLADYTRYCNGSDCPAPYFIASRRSQKYCSPECAVDSQRQFKKRWWAKKGKAWRAVRAKASKRTKHHPQ